MQVKINKYNLKNKWLDRETFSMHSIIFISIMSFIKKNNKKTLFKFLMQWLYLLELFLINCFIVPRFVRVLVISSYTISLIITVAFFFIMYEY